MIGDVISKYPFLLKRQFQGGVLLFLLFLLFSYTSYMKKEEKEAIITSKKFSLV